jgi:hypothetical protein
VAKASTVARGYGYSHRRKREELRPLVEMGQAVCSRCGRQIAPDAPWDLDHLPDRSGWAGPAHRYCNRVAGSRVANARRQGRRSPRVMRTAVYGPLSS